MGLERVHHQTKVGGELSEPHLLRHSVPWCIDGVCQQGEIAQPWLLVRWPDSGVSRTAPRDFRRA